MTEEQAALDAGTNAPESEVQTADTNGSTPSTQDQSGNKGVQKLLSQRNEYRTAAEQLAAENAELKAMIENTVHQTIDLKAKQEELNSFKANVEPEVAGEVEQFIQRNPGLSVQQAFNALYPEKAVQKGPSYSMSGNVPDRVKVDKPLSEASIDEVKQAAMQDLQAMGVRGRF